MREFECRAAQEGFFAGPVYAVDSKAEIEKIDAGDGVPDEIRKLESAVAGVKEKVAGNMTSDIMATVSMMLDDDAFIGEIRDFIARERCNAGYAVMFVADDYAAKLAESESDYLRGRSADIRGVGKKLLAEINGTEEKTLAVRSAIAAAEISPAEMAAFDTDLIGGMVTDKGSPNSHVSILAGSLGIPYVYGAGEAIAEVMAAEYVIIDGAKVILDPDAEVRAAAEERLRQLDLEREERREAMQDAVCRTKIYANIAGPEDVPALLESGADGVGLFRSEFLFLHRDDAPGEDEQFEAYRTVLEAMEDREVIIRTMDLGSDKKVPWLGLPDETNPALGLRGVRVSLERNEVFDVQLRALLRAAVYGNLKIMFPMIASSWEIDEITDRIRAAAEALDREGDEYRIPDIGIMVETPAAAVMSEQIAGKVKFFSIGTNDLTQYTLAIDREAQGLDRYFAPHHDAVLKLVAMTAEGGHRHGVTTGVCGQMAADPEMIEKLILAGVDELSVPVAKVRETRAYAAEAEKRIEESGAASQAGAADQVGEAGQADAVDQAGTSGPGDNVSEHAGQVELAAPADGELIPMKEIPDPVFAAGQLGECIGIIPENGNIYSPCDGRIIGVAETKHAITIGAEDGTGVLVHVGIDTVSLDGRGFDVLVREGEHVKKSQQIMTADFDVIRQAGLSDMVILVKMK